MRFPGIRVGKHPLNNRGFPNGNALAEEHDGEAHSK